MERGGRGVGKEEGEKKETEREEGREGRRWGEKERPCQ